MKDGFDEKREQFRRALDTLHRAFLDDPSDLEIDGAIQRFEYCLEIAWNLLKRRLDRDGNTTVSSPKAVFGLGMLAGYIDDEHAWLGMLDDRNLSVHTYDEMTSRAIYERLPKHHAAMLDLLRRLDQS